MRAVVGILVVLLLLIGADALARTVAERAAADRLETSLDLDGGARVSLGGWPFLLHLFGGEFPSATVTVDHTSASGLRLADVSVQLKGVSFAPFSPQAAVEIEGGKGRAELDAATVNRALDRRGVPARVTFRGGRAMVTSPEFGGDVPAQIEIRGDSLAIVGAAGTFSLPLPSFADDFSYESVEIDGATAVVHFRIGAGPLTSQ